MLSQYIKSLYSFSMKRAYDTAYNEIATSFNAESTILDCGAGNGWTYKHIAERCALTQQHYKGIEWGKDFIMEAQAANLDVSHADLNINIPCDNDSFSCVYGLSVLEHLLNPCRFLRESHRVLQPGGKLVLLTPNISTYFTALLILMGKMPSSGPHPDSEQLLQSEEIFKVSRDSIQSDAESDTPCHRHLIVFSYRVLRDYLAMLGFKDIQGYGFGHYPFPKFTQPLLEKIDPYHCHQMVFVARK